MITRLLYFAYGLFAYLLFLGTFLYAIAFVGGFGVSPTLDAAASAPFAAALAVDLLLLGLFAVQHSVMARRWFKARWTQIVPWAIERSTYVLCASLALLLLFWQWRPIGIQIWSVEHAGARLALWTLFAVGWGTVLVVTFLINHFDLFGLRQVWLPLVGQPYTRITFRTPMPYRFVRHPLYFGFWSPNPKRPISEQARQAFLTALTGPVGTEAMFRDDDARMWNDVTVTHTANRVVDVAGHQRPALELSVVRHDALGRADVRAEMQYLIEREYCSGTVELREYGSEELQVSRIVERHP